MPAQRILVVDDSKFMLEWASDVLRSAGYEVSTCARSLGLTALVMDQKPDLVLLDVCMAALPGDAVCKLLRSNPHTSKVLVALHSSLPENELRERSEAAGADAYITKSEDSHEFTRKVKEVLARAR